jgi:ABC-type nitrate/sulfonate/bicarbonate transport system substrate-binding protein
MMSPNPLGNYVTTHLVSSVRFLKEQPELMKKWIAAHVELTQWSNQHPEEAKKILNEESRSRRPKRCRKRLSIVPDPSFIGEVR